MDWFTADLHLDHRNIIKYCNRPFTSIAEMNAHFIDKINTHVNRSRDSLWILGDMCYRGHERWRQAIKCDTVHLIIGNHDLRQSVREARSEFNLVERQYELRVSGRYFFLTHYAPAIWPRMHYGSLALYGHSHGNAEAMLDEKFPGRRSMDVGVDNIARLTGEYRPISLTEVVERLAKRPGHTIDHHTGANAPDPQGS